MTVPVTDPVTVTDPDAVTDPVADAVTVTDAVAERSPPDVGGGEELAFGGCGPTWGTRRERLPKRQLASVRNLALLLPQ